MFTRFYAETEQGAVAWNQMASELDGAAAVLNCEAKRVISELRKAGYVVAKAKPERVSDDDLLSELGV